MLSAPAHNRGKKPPPAIDVRKFAKAPTTPAGAAATGFLRFSGGTSAGAPPLTS